MEVPRRRRRADDHFDDRRRQPDDALDARQQLIVERRRPATARRASRCRLLRRIERRDVVGEQRDDVRVAVLRRGHRLDDVAVVARMVVAVVADELAVGVVRGEEAVRVGLEREAGAVAVLRTAWKPLKNFCLPSSSNDAGMFLLVGDVRHRAGGDQHGARRQLDASMPSARVNAIALTWPNSSGIASTGFMFSVKAMPSFSALRDFFVIQPIGRRVLQALAIRERDAAPAADQAMKFGASPAAAARARSALHGRGRARRNSSRMPSSSASIMPRTRASPRSRDQRVVAIEDLLDLDRVIGHQLGGGIDAGQAAADDHRRQPRLQVRQRVRLERAGQLQRHQEVAGLADAANQVVLDVDDRRPAGAGGDRDVIDADAPTPRRAAARRRSGRRRRSAACRGAPASGGSASGSSCPSAR